MINFQYEFKLWTPESFIQENIRPIGCHIINPFALVGQGLPGPSGAPGEAGKPGDQVSVYCQTY